MCRLFVLALLFLAVALASAQDGALDQIGNTKHAELQHQALNLHNTAVLGITNGKSLDSRLPLSTQDKFSGFLLDEANKRKLDAKPNDVTYREAIKWSEDAMAELGLQVTMTVTASPGSCNVTYKPVVGDAILDAGATRVVKRVDPRWYDISCDCKAPPMVRRVDCTSDTTIAFTCPPPRATVHPDKEP
jgi:hypothetical protein